MKKNAFFLHFFSKKFGHIKKKQYLCTRFREGTTSDTKTGDQTRFFTLRGRLAQLV